MKKLLLAALVATALPAHAWDPEFYAGSQASSWLYTQSRPKIDSNFNLWTVEGLGGVKLFPHVTVEGRVGAGVNRDQVGGIELEATYFGSLYFRPVIENEKASLYGLLGYTMIEFDGEPQPAGAELEHDGLSVGVGVSFVATPDVDVRAEWKQLIDGEVLRMRGLTVGFTYTF